MTINRKKRTIMLLALSFVGNMYCMDPEGHNKVAYQTVAVPRTRVVVATTAAVGLTTVSSYLFYKSISHIAQKVLVKMVGKTFDTYMKPASITATLATGATLYFVGLPIMHYAYAKFIGKPGYFVDKMYEALQGYIKTWVTLKIIQLSFNALIQAFDGKRTVVSVDDKHTRDLSGEIQSKYTIHEMKDDVAAMVEALDLHVEAVRIDRILSSHRGCINSCLDICDQKNILVPDDLLSWLSIENEQNNDGDINIYRSIIGREQLVTPSDIQVFLQGLNEGPRGIYRDFLTTPFLKDAHAACTITIPQRLWLKDSSSLLYGINHDISTQCIQFVSMVDEIVYRKTAASAYTKTERTIVPLFNRLVDDCQKALDRYKRRIMAYRRMTYLP